MKNINNEFEYGIWKRVENILQEIFVRNIQSNNNNNNNLYFKHHISYGVYKSRR